MTWQEFKKLVEDDGVEDKDEIFYIDTGNNPKANRLEARINAEEGNWP